jgi:hypothetical protein
MCYGRGEGRGVSIREKMITRRFCTTLYVELGFRKEWERQCDGLQPIVVAV